LLIDPAHVQPSSLSLVQPSSYPSNGIEGMRGCHPHPPPSIAYKTHNLHPARLTQTHRNIIPSAQEFRDPDDDGVRSQENSRVLCAATAAAACRRGPRGGQLLPGRGHHVGRRARQDPRRRRRPHAVPRPGLRLRFPVQEPVPVRPVRHADQARPRRLRRHRRHFLPVVAGFGARRDRLRVPGERERAALHGAHQRVQPGQGRPGAAVPHVDKISCMNRMQV
uniref:Uncharacterized protein n=1 Tax=Aegilops tauschii subsp. strangulata TaxID=200361 RepID=A0A453SQZ4_AEGTS